LKTMARAALASAVGAMICASRPAGAKTIEATDIAISGLQASLTR